MNINNSVHIVVGGKGGGGKSPTAVAIATWLAAQNPETKLYSIDTENATVMLFKSLNVVDTKPLRLSEAGNLVVDENKLAPYVTEWGKATAPVVVDVGTSATTGFGAWALASELEDVLEEDGKEVFIHAIGVGGLEYEHNMKSLQGYLTLTFVNSKVVFWENEYVSGPAKDKKGVALRDSELVTELAEEGRVLGFLRMPKSEPAQLQIIEEAWGSGMTAHDVKASEKWDSIKKRPVTRYYTTYVEEPLNQLPW